MKLDYIIPASLTDGFCGQIAFFRSCLNALGGPYEEARLVAVFGDPPEPEVPERWKPFFTGVDVEWVYNTTPYAKENYTGQHWARYDVFRPDCDLVILCDADVAQLRPMDGLERRLIEESAIGGVVAHDHFPTPGRKMDPVESWAELGRKVLGVPITDFPYRYTLTPPDTPPQTPFYVNYGVVIGPPEAMRALYHVQKPISDAMPDFVRPYFAPQVAIALACLKADLTCHALPMRYNFPNDRKADALYPAELEQIVFLHYLRKTIFRRDEIFSNSEKFDAFISADLEGSDEVFRRHVVKITGGRFPFQS